MRKWMTIILLITLIMSGCAQGANYSPETDSEQEPKPPITENPGASSNEEDAPPHDEAEGDSKSPENQGTDEVTDEKPEPVEITYYMNGIYDIKPIDEGTDEHVVLLTFDDGPKELDMLNTILDTLDKHDAKAIFFVNGFRVEANPDLLRLIYDKGHAIGNHSWDHINLKKESEDSIRRQVDDVQAIVEQTIGERPQFFRPPHGSSNEYLREYVKEQGMLFMTWSNGSLDWDANHQTPEAVVANVMDQLRPGSNILMHELPWTAEALDDLLTELEDAGYSFVDPHAIRIEVPEESGEGAA